MRGAAGGTTQYVPILPKSPRIMQKSAKPTQKSANLCLESAMPLQKSPKIARQTVEEDLSPAKKIKKEEI